MLKAFFCQYHTNTDLNFQTSLQSQRSLYIYHPKTTLLQTAPSGGIQSKSSCMACAKDAHIRTPAAEAMVHYKWLTGRFWEEPSVCLHWVNTQPANSQNSDTIKHLLSVTWPLWALHTFSQWVKPAQNSTKHVHLLSGCYRRWKCHREMVCFLIRQVMGSQSKKIFQPLSSSVHKQLLS